IGRQLWDALPEGIDSRATSELRAAVADGQPRVFEMESAVLDSWLEVHAYPSDNGLSVYMHDIGARKQAEAAQKLLVESGIALSTSLDLEAVLANAARAGIPYLADFCTIDLIRAGEAMVRAASAAADPETEEQLLRLERRYPPDWRLPSAAMEALRTGAAVVAADLSTAAMLVQAPDPELLRFAQELNACSALTVPLVVHGRRLGAITFVYGRSGRRHDAGDLGVAGDLARRIAIALDNARLYQEAQESNRAKTNFIGVISHEFRTPLTAIVGYADLLMAKLAGPLTEKQNDQLGRIKSSAWHLTHLVEEILTFSRMDAGRERAEREPVNVVDVAQKAAMLIEPVAAAKRIPLRVEMPAEPLITHTDAGKVSQILVNLLSNAVKFTTEGEVRLRAWECDLRYVIEVTDTGIGIAPEDRERIFDSFWQVDHGPTRRAGGTGLGLTIARHLTQLLGGHLEVTSEMGRGSSFTVSLPVTSPTKTVPGWPDVVASG
ncbi:MAG: sensor histidine kinase, partial [Planctomycetaceae bacterium]